MRAIESTRYPTQATAGGSISPTGAPIGFIEVNGTPPTEVSVSNYINDWRVGSPPTFILLPQPRLGRKWTVDRVSLTNLRVLEGGALLPNQTPQFALNYKLLLNDVPVSEVFSLIYEVVDNPGPNFIEMTAQNGPRSITPYNPLEVFSGDQLKVEVTWGIDRQIGVGDVFVIYLETQLQIIGVNEPARLHS